MTRELFKHALKLAANVTHPAFFRIQAPTLDQRSGRRCSCRRPRHGGTQISCRRPSVQDRPMVVPCTRCPQRLRYCPVACTSSLSHESDVGSLVIKEIPRTALGSRLSSATRLCNTLSELCAATSCRAEPGCAVLVLRHATKTRLKLLSY